MSRLALGETSLIKQKDKTLGLFHKFLDYSVYTPQGVSV